jgi:hypothetical protein
MLVLRGIIMSAFNIRNLFINKNMKGESSPPDESIGSDIGDEELVAAITAAVIVYMGADRKCRLEIKSIRRAGQTSPVWNRAGRLERISDKL